MLAWFGNKKRAEGMVGLSINDERIALAHITRKREDVFLEKCVREALSAGGRDGMKGVRDRLPALVDELGLSGTNCSCLLSPRDYNIYLVEAPEVEPDEMRSAVRWKIKDLLDMPIEEAAIDVFPLPEDALRGRSPMIYAVAANKARVEQMIEVVDRSGMTLDAIDIPEMAMRNLTATFADDSNGLAFIALKQSGSTMNLSREGQLYLTRRINTPVAADALLQDDWESLRDRLALEIQRSLDYYESQMGQNPISKILMAPRQSDTDTMTTSLTDALAAPIDVFNFADRLPSSDSISAELKGACMMVIGAALRIDSEGAGN
ncbi:MAG: hypothetical protein WD071_12100 [Pseudohongiella sp.]|uniref:hypothetical protein n=1 Tax=Pseudohongiella sp. TaxID=1979412 RepID=UPI00349FF113